MQTDMIRKIIKDFCIEFVNYPYLCYTEHGHHARFYCLLYNALPPDQRYLEWEGKRICVIQKEYPTAGALGKSRRQNWDIAIIQSPLSSLPGKSPSYDYLTLNSVVEFGLNVLKNHLVDDIERLCHPNSNVKNKFIIHLYRLSNGTSSRDWSPDSAQLLKLKEIANLAHDKDIEIYFGQFDITGQSQSGVWQINKNNISELFIAK